VEYADLAVIDLSNIDTVEGRTRLAAQVARAMTTQGFFYAINHGYTPEQVGSKNPYHLNIRSIPFWRQIACLALPTLLSMLSVQMKKPCI